MMSAIQPLTIAMSRSSAAAAAMVFIIEPRPEPVFGFAVGGSSSPSAFGAAVGGFVVGASPSGATPGLVLGAAGFAGGLPSSCGTTPAADGESDLVGGTAAAGGGGIGGGGVPFGQLMTTSISSPGPNDANSFPAHLIPSSSCICIAFGVT